MKSTNPQKSISRLRYCMSMQALFTEVSGKYHTVTRVLSLGQDSKWKQNAVEHISAYFDRDPATILDIACGTGDFAYALAEKYRFSRIYAVDLTCEMLLRARESETADRINFSIQDMNAIAIRNASVDLITEGYALRNAADTSGAIAEAARVLKPGGIALFLDFSRLNGAPARFVQYCVLLIWGALWGLLLHAKPQVYMYIARSLVKFPLRHELRNLFRQHDLEPQWSVRHFFGFIETIIVRKSTLPQAATR